MHLLKPANSVQRLRMFAELGLLAILAALSAQPAMGNGTPVNVAVAANFVSTAALLVEDYNLGQPINLISGSSGKLYAQITQGAPFHIFLSADQTKPDALAGSRFAVADSQFTYAEGQLVFWQPRQAPNAQTLTANVVAGVAPLALANPKLAPYGLAAVQTLGHLGIAESTRADWVQGENIAQAYQYIASGNAAGGFVARAQITAATRGVYAVPQAWHMPIRQDAILLHTATEHTAAQAFYAYLQTDHARQIIRNAGYRVPQTARQAHNL